MAAAAVLAACGEFRPVPLSPAQNGAALEGRSLDGARLRQFIAGALGTADADPAAVPWGLAQLTLAALYYHPDLDIARAELGAAEAAVTTAGQRPNPRLDLTAAVGTAAAAGAVPAAALPMTLGPAIDVVVETAGKREYRTEAAQHLAAAARASLAAAAWQVRGGVRGALLDLWAAEERSRLLRRRVALADELVDLLQGRLAAGAASALDLARERIRRGDDALALTGAAQAQADARARLAGAIGVPLGALNRVRLSFAAFERPPLLPSAAALGDLRRRALLGRSDVAAALARYAAAQSRLQLAIAGQYPDVTLSPGYQYDFGVNKYLLSPSLVLPIFNRNEGPIAEAVAARQLAAARFTALQANIIAGVDRAAADCAGAAAAVATGDALVSEAARRVAQTERALRAGGTDRPTLVAAELEAASAELSRFAAVVRQLEALGRLEDAAQYPLFGPPTAVPAPAGRSPRGPEPGA